MIFKKDQTMLALGQNQDPKEVKIYTACCLMLIHVCVKFGMRMSKSKEITVDYVQTQIHGEMYE